MSDRLSKLAHQLRPLRRGLRQQVVPAVQLARLDATVLRVWLGRVGAVRETLGAAEGMAYTRLVVAAAERDVEVTRIVAYTLPDHLARVARPARSRYLSLLRAVLRDDIAALPLVVRTLPDLLDRIEEGQLAQYLSRGLALHRTSPRKAESFFKLESHESQTVADELQRGTALSTVHRTLTLYARAHCGADVQIRTGGTRAFTDGHHLYLPERVDHFGDERDFLVYRVLTARNAGYLEFGTLDLDLSALDATFPEPRPDELPAERFLRSFTNPVLAKDLFTIFENTRVEACVRREYPGIARDMDALHDAWRPSRPQRPTMTAVEQAVEWLYQTTAGHQPSPPEDERAAQAALAAASHLDSMRDPQQTVHSAALATLMAYPALEALMRHVNDSDLRPPTESDASTPNPSPSSSPSTPSDPSPHRPQPSEDDLPAYRPLSDDPLTGMLDTDQLSAEDRAIEAQAQALRLAMQEADQDVSAQKIRQRLRDGSSYAEMAAFLDRMEAPGGPMTQMGRPTEEQPPNVDGQANNEALQADDVEAFLYPEWDAGIDDHKPNWVRLTEHVLPAGNVAFVEQVRREHGPLLHQIRRAFEALRPESIRRVRGVTDGDELDIDRAIEARVEQRSGASPSERIYIRRRRQERDVAVAFLLDMSSSTNEIANQDGRRILDVEKEALVLIAEAVHAIGDAFAIYGFSGYGRDAVAFYIAKDFTDRWDRHVAERVGQISWKMENRDGAAIRHCIQKLSAAPQKVKLLLLLSDGKPLDCGCDHYTDRYAQQDTRMALMEARRQGIHPFCITVDPHGQDYLSAMYGDNGYIVINRVDALPMQLPRIYRRLTR